MNKYVVTPNTVIEIDGEENSILWSRRVTELSVAIGESFTVIEYMYGGHKFVISAPRHSVTVEHSTDEPRSGGGVQRDH